MPVVIKASVSENCEVVTRAISVTVACQLHRCSQRYNCARVRHRLYVVCLPMKSIPVRLIRPIPVILAQGCPGEAIVAIHETKTPPWPRRFSFQTDTFLRQISKWPKQMTADVQSRFFSTHQQWMNSLIGNAYKVVCSLTVFISLGLYLLALNTDTTQQNCHYLVLCLTLFRLYVAMRPQAKATLQRWVCACLCVCASVCRR